MRAEDYRSFEERLEGWPVRFTSYRLGDRYYCHVDNVEPGAVIARAETTTREEAEGSAREQARRRLSRGRDGG